MDTHEVLKEFKNIAVVGCSKNPEKDANRIPSYMQSQGYNVIPINPSADEILGVRAYKTLSEVPDKIDIVNVFRPSDEVAAIVEETLKRDDVKVIWTQLGIKDDDAAKKAQEKGLTVIQDRCIMVEHKMMG